MQVIILRAALDDANEKLAAYGQQKNSEPIKSGQEAETD
jgi:hypothetical protein